MMLTKYMKKISLITYSFIMVLLVACNESKKESKASPPSVQSNPVKETDLNTITLTENAIKRLGIQTAEIVESSISNSRVFSGEVMATPGKTITVTAPVAGTLLFSKSLNVGQQVRKGQSLFSIQVLPAERDLLGVQDDVIQREAQYTMAIAKRDRTAQMYEEGSGSLRARQEAEAELATVTAQLRVARSRVQLLRGNTAGASRLSTLQVPAPITGVIQRLYSGSSQMLSASAPIVDIISSTTVWVRVPVYAGDEANINKSGTAVIRSLSNFSGLGSSVMARPVTGPQTSDPLASSVDVYYELDNSKGVYRPGQRVGATLPYTGSRLSLVVPYAAILYDINGGTWVYERTAPTVFVRRRVELQGVTNNMAVLARGPAAGIKVVTAGAAELFGTEFGGGK